MTDFPQLRRDDLFDYADEHGRVGWRRLTVLEDGIDVIVRLPCGHVVTLAKVHEIQDDGQIKPGLKCVKDLPKSKKCNQSFEVRLEGWT